MDRIEVKDFILEAIREGISEAAKIYLTHLEESLKVDVEIQEAGGPVNYLQKLINESSDFR